MNNKTLKLVALIAFALPIFAHAEVALNDNSEILGKWNVYAEATKLDGEKKAIMVEWDFKADGTLQTKATDSRGRTKEMKIAIKYAVENGEIKKQTKPGQEKYETCKVVEKEASNMVLKCQFLYYFLSKI